MTTQRHDPARTNWAIVHAKEGHETFKLTAYAIAQGARVDDRRDDCPICQALVKARTPRTHATCDHPSTKAARAACRQARAKVAVESIHGV